jgi:hypothetical protein
LKLDVNDAVVHHNTPALNNTHQLPWRRERKRERKRKRKRERER